MCRLCCNYYRLFEEPTGPSNPSWPNPPVHLTGSHVGWVFEDSASRSGIMYLMAQATSSNTVVTVALSHQGGWPEAVPAPGVVRSAQDAKPAFTLLAGAAETDVALYGPPGVPELRVTFPCLDSQALLSYTY